MGLNPGAGYWMDMTFFTFICCKNCIVCLKKTENKQKRGRGWPNFFKNIMRNCFGVNIGYYYPFDRVQSIAHGQRKYILATESTVIINYFAEIQGIRSNLFIISYIYQLNCPSCIR